MGRGSMRQRGNETWELRVYLGTETETGRQRWATKTVHGSRRAESQLAAFVEEAGYARIRAGTVGDLLEQWFAAASPGWAASTERETRSLLRCHLLPHLGHLPVAKLTTADIDDLYGYLLRAAGRFGRPLAPSTVHRIHVVCTGRLPRPCAGNGSGSIRPARPTRRECRRPRFARRVPNRWPRSSTPYGGEHLLSITYLRLAVSTGARRSQLLALRWANVDTDRSAVAFTRALRA